MFRRRENAPILLFGFGDKVFEVLHSLFVFFPFLLIFLDGEEIIEVKLVKPFRFWIRPKKKFTGVVEIPINLKHRREIDFFIPQRRGKKHLKRNEA